MEKVLSFRRLLTIEKSLLSQEFLIHKNSICSSQNVFTSRNSRGFVAFEHSCTISDPRILLRGLASSQLFIIGFPDSTSKKGA